jgi:hypothetical protein
MGRNQHLVSRLQPRRAKLKRERIQSIAHRHTVARSTPGGELLLKGLDLPAQNKPSRIHHPGKRLVDQVAITPSQRTQIQKRDRGKWRSHGL